MNRRPCCKCGNGGQAGDDECVLDFLELSIAIAFLIRVNSQDTTDLSVAGGAGAVCPKDDIFDPDVPRTDSGLAGVNGDYTLATTLTRDSGAQTFYFPGGSGDGYTDVSQVLAREITSNCVNVAPYQAPLTLAVSGSNSQTCSVGAGSSLLCDNTHIYGGNMSQSGDVRSFPGVLFNLFCVNGAAQRTLASQGIADALVRIEPTGTTEEPRVQPLSPQYLTLADINAATPVQVWNGEGVDLFIVGT